MITLFYRWGAGDTERLDTAAEIGSELGSNSMYALRSSRKTEWCCCCIPRPWQTLRALDAYSLDGKGMWNPSPLFPRKLQQRFPRNLIGDFINKKNTFLLTVPYRQVDRLILNIPVHIILGWPISSFGFFHNILWENPMNLLASSIFLFRTLTNTSPIVKYLHPIHNRPKTCVLTLLGSTLKI